MRLSNPLATRQRHRLGRWAVLILAIVLLLYAGFSLWQTWMHVAALRAHLAALRSVSPTDPGRLRASLQPLPRDVALLRRDLRLPLALAPHLGWLPGIGPTLQAAPALWEGGEALLTAGVTVWDSLEEPASAVLADPAHPERALPALSREIVSHTVALEAAAADVRRAVQRLDAVDPSRLPPRLAHPFAQMRSSVTLLKAALEVLPLLPRLINLPGEQTYLILSQNNDELRPTGGVISSFGALTVTQGIPHLAPFVDSYRVDDWSKPHKEPPEPLRKYMGLDLWVARDGNWWPDFPTSARAVSEIYGQDQERRVDGVVAVDMLAAARLVEALTPLRLPSGAQIKSGQVMETFRASWSLPASSLVTPGMLITATRPFTAVELILSYSNMEGTAWFDSAVLEDFRRPGVNLVRNPSFEEDVDQNGLPDGWQATGLAPGDRLVSDQAHSGRRSLLIRGDAQVAKTLAQRIDLSGAPGTRLRVSAESRADSPGTKGGPYALGIVLLGTDGQVESKVAGFPALTHDWASAGTTEVLGTWWTHRKDFMNQMMQAALQKMVTERSKVRWLELFAAAREVLDERHIQVYMADPALQAVVERQGWAGALAPADEDYLLVVDSNMGYNKISTSIQQSMHYELNTQPAGPPRAHLTVRYHNRSTKAPEEGCDKFKQYVPTYDTLTEGCYWDYVRIYVPAGARLVASAGGDEPVTTHTELGHTVFATYLILKPGERRELHLEYELPAGLLTADTYALRWQKQAGTEAIPVTVTLTAPKALAVQPGGLQPQRLTSGYALYATDLRVDRYLAMRQAPLQAFLQRMGLVLRGGVGLWLVLLGLGGGVAVLLIRAKSWLARPAPADLALLLLLLLVLVSVFVSPLPKRTDQALAPLVLGVMVYLGLSKWPMRILQLRGLWWGLILTGALLCLVAPPGMLPSYDSWLRRVPLWSALQRRMPDTFNPNVVAGAMVLLMPFGFARALVGWGEWSWKSGIESVLAGGVGLAVLGVVFLASSRGALLGTATALVVLVALLRPRTLLVAVPMGLLGLLVAAQRLGWRGMVDALLVSSATEGWGERVEIWSRALYIIQDFPLTGVGLGCFEPVVSAMYPLFRVPEGTVSHAHNLYLQVAVDLGIPGLIAMLAVLGLAFRGAWMAYRRWQRAGQRELVLLAVACLASLAGLTIHGFLDSAIWGNKGAFLPWAVFGLCTALINANAQTPQPSPAESAMYSS